MIWHVSIRAAARTDLEETREWYERQRPGLGDGFLHDLAAATNRTDQAPVIVLLPVLVPRAATQIHRRLRRAYRRFKDPIQEGSSALHATLHDRAARSLHFSRRDPRFGGQLDLEAHYSYRNASTGSSRDALTAG